MDSNTSEIATDEFAFAGVNATAHFDAKGPYGIPKRGGTPDRPSRPIKCGKKPISSGADLAPSVELQRFADLNVELVQQFAPGIVSDGCNMLGRSNNICMQRLIKFDQLCAGNVLRQVAGMPDFDHGITRSMNNECRHAGSR
jgi:hypothetical protein